MNALFLFVPVVVAFLLVQIVKPKWPWLNELAPLRIQGLVVLLTVGLAVLYAKAGLPLPDDLRSAQTAALVGLVQGLAAIGTHGVKKGAEAEPRPPT